MTQRPTKRTQPSAKFRRMAEIYKYFSRSWEHVLEFSDESMLELFLSETYGDVECQPNNGYLWGKRWLNVNVAMWREDLDKGFLYKCELFEDPDLPNWWLHGVFNHSPEYAADLDKLFSES